MARFNWGSNNITPDLTIMKKLNWSNEKLTYLSYVGKTAKDALRIIEKAVEIHNEKRRENNNELRYLEEEENRSKGKSASVGLSDRSTERSAATELDRSNDILRLRGQSGESTMEEGNSDRERGGNSSILEEYSESDEQLDNVGVRVQPGKLHLHTGDEEFRAVDGGRTGGNLRSEMVRDDGEGLRSGTGTPTGSSSATERSEGSGENGENLSGNTGETVRGEQPTSDRQLRSDSTMGENKTVRSGQPSDERNSITAIHSSNTDEIIPENAIHNAFSEFISNHSFADEQKEFFDRIEKYSVKNTVTENIIDKAFSERPAYRRAYISKENLSQTMFNHSLTALENELERKIKENLSENSVKIAVSSQQESLEAIDVSSEETEGQEMAISFDIPSIDISLRNDFQSGKLSFSEVAAELHAANLISHIDDYERIAEILGTEALVSQLDATLDKYYINADTIAPPIIPCQKDESRKEIYQGRKM